MNDGDSPKHEFAIREWWTRKTKKVSRYILVSSIVSMIASILFFEFASPALIARIQIFNGAMTLPVGGAIWIAAFIFQFLIPSREVAFRSQETLERTELRVKQSLDMFEKFMQEEAVPSIQLLRKTVEAFETKYAKNIESTIYVCQNAAKNAVETAQRTEVMAQDIHREVLPVLASAARVIEKIDGGLNGGLLGSLSLLVNGTAPGAPGAIPGNGASSVPDLNRALTTLSKKHVTGRIIPKKAPEATMGKPGTSFHEALAIRVDEKTLEQVHPRVLAVPVPEVERSIS